MSTSSVPPRECAVCHEELPQGYVDVVIEFATGKEWHKTCRNPMTNIMQALDEYKKNEAKNG